MDYALILLAGFVFAGRLVPLLQPSRTFLIIISSRPNACVSMSKWLCRFIWLWCLGMMIAACNRFFFATSLLEYGFIWIFGNMCWLTSAFMQHATTQVLAQMRLGGDVHYRVLGKFLMTLFSGSKARQWYAAKCWMACCSNRARIVVPWISHSEIVHFLDLVCCLWLEKWMVSKG